MGWFTKEAMTWGEASKNIAIDGKYGDPITFEDIAQGVDVQHNEFKMPKQGKTWAEVRPTLADLPPPEWFSRYHKDWQDFVATAEPGTEIHRFYWDGGMLAERAGLVITKDGQYIGALITWLS